MSATSSLLWCPKGHEVAYIYPSLTCAISDIIDCFWSCLPHCACFWGCVDALKLDWTDESSHTSLSNYKKTSQLNKKETAFSQCISEHHPYLHFSSKEKQCMYKGLNIYNFIPYNHATQASVPSHGYFGESCIGKKTKINQVFLTNYWDSALKINVWCKCLCKVPREGRTQ